MVSLGILIAQCRYYLQTLGPNVGIICILGSLGYLLQSSSQLENPENFGCLIPSAYAVGKRTVRGLGRLPEFLGFFSSIRTKVLVIISASTITVATSSPSHPIRTPKLEDQHRRSHHLSYSTPRLLSVLAVLGDP